MKTIDLNCDVGEGVGNEALLMPWITSCNICCGLHAGGADVMREVVRLAKDHEVRIGAHPGFNDRENFGRKEHDLSYEDGKDLILNQLSVLDQIAKEEGAKILYVKPHGALYNMAARSVDVCGYVIDAIKEFDSELALMGLSGSQMEKEADGNLNFIHEGFADRRYASLTKLQPRNQNGLLETLEEKVNQSFDLSNQRVMTLAGQEDVVIDSICLHGDGENVEEVVRAVHEYLVHQGVKLMS